MTHTLHTSIKTANFDQSDYKVHLTRDLEWTTLNHPSQKTPVTPQGAWGQASAPYDAVFMRRLSDFIKSNIYFLEPGSMWGDLYMRHQAFLHLLLTDALEPAHDLLNLMYKSPLMIGMSQGSEEFDLISKYPDTVGVMRLKRHWDVFLGLMEYYGIISPQNHEQGSSYLAMPLNDMLDALPTYLHAPPWQGGLWALDTKRGLFSDRDLIALYLALKLRESMPPGSSITEIGGGAGYLGYWLFLLNFKKIRMVDLPSVVCAQAYQLAQNIGAENICLPNEEYRGQAVKFLTPDQFINYSESTDLVVNCDSMPEMDESSLHHYLNTIARVSKFFYSINQESGGTYGSNKQHVVHRIIKTNYASRYQRVDRNIFWLRDGYTEEWYTIR